MLRSPAPLPSPPTRRRSCSRSIRRPGTIGQDLYVTNFVDLDDGPGVRDYACGGQSYDGHTGIDSIIRSFREVRIGVPVFAALDGRVLSVQQGVGGDFNWGPTVSNFDNHVILDHGGDQQSVYGHLAGKSIARQEGAVGRRRHPDRADGLERQLELAAPPLHRPPELRAVRALCRRLRDDGRMGGAARDPGRGLGRRRRAEREGVRREGGPPVRRGGPDRHVRPRHPLRQRPGRGAQPRRGRGGQAVDPAAGRERRVRRGALGLGLPLRLGEAAAEAEPGPARALEPRRTSSAGRSPPPRRSTSSRHRSRSSTGRRTRSRPRSSPRPRAPARSSSAGSRPRS